MSKSNNDSIKRTGELLLSGWKMLNKSCPICNTALLSKGENLRCPTCDCAVVTEANQAAVQNATQLQHISVVPQQRFEIEDDYYQYAASGNVKHQSLEEEKKEYDSKNKARNDEVSDKIGTKMLSGWSMLSTICPQEGCRGTPLMRLGTGPMLCVACDSEYKCSALGDLVPMKSSLVKVNTTINAASPQPSKTTPAIATPTTSAPTVSTNIPAVAAPSASEDASFYLDMNNAPILDMSRFSVNADDASSKISRKLMQGWALLDKCCGSAECRGEVPLMRDLNGQECCVQCGFPNAPAFTKTSAVQPSSSATGALTRTRAAAPKQRQEADVPGLCSDSSDGDSGDSDSNTSSDRLKQQNKRSRGRAELKVKAAENLSDDDSVADMLLFESFQQLRAELDEKRASSAQTTAAPSRAKPVGNSASAASARAAACGGAGVKGACVTTGVVHHHHPAGTNTVAVPLQILHQKVQESAEQLSGCSNIDTCIKLADLIAKLGTAIHSLQSL